MMKEKQLKQKYVTPVLTFEEIDADCMLNNYSVGRPGGTEEEQPLSVDTGNDWVITE